MASKGSWIISFHRCLYGVLLLGWRQDSGKLNSGRQDGD
jgi:hypothetical protein